MAYARSRSAEEAGHQTRDSHQVQGLGGMDKAMLELQNRMKIWDGRGLVPCNS